MSPPEWIPASRLRGNVKPEIFVALEELERQGWKFRKQGHGYRAYCPCDTRNGGRGAAIPGSPGRPGNAAKRLLRNAEHCPDQHDLIR